MKSFVPILIAVSLATPASAARAPVERNEQGALADYVRARAAADLGQFDVAAQSYEAASRAAPEDRRLAVGTLRQAVAAGDMALAFRTAHQLDAASALPPDGTVLLLTEAMLKDDWRRAAELANRIETQKLFAFLVPVVRAWIAFGQHHADPQRLIDAGQSSAIAAVLAPDHRVLMMIAGGDTAAGAQAFSTLDLPANARATRLRIAAAATLVARGDRTSAKALLVGDDPAIARARALIDAGRSLPGAVDTPRAGVAELFVRIAADVARAQAGALALEFARSATWLAPADSEAWLVTSSLLAATGDTKGSLAALAKVPADDPLIGSVRDARLTLLLRDGRKDEALAEAKSAIDDRDASSGDWARYGDLLSDRKAYPEAAAAYRKALSLGGEKRKPADAWPLLLQEANAELLAGDWPTAKTTAEKALAIAPEEPATLNFLGYSELDRGGSVQTASALIAKASTLAPDDPSITDSLGWSWYVRGDLAKAIPLLERAARGAPANAEINDHLGDAYWRAGRRLEARFAWRAALVVAEPDEAPRIRAKIDAGLPAATGRS